MGGLLSPPKPPKPIKAPEKETVDEAAIARLEQDRQRFKQGRAATMLTGDDATGQPAKLGTVGTRFLVGGGS